MESTGGTASEAELEHVVRSFAGGREIGLHELWTRLADTDAVFLGEEHLDATTHRFQLAAFEALIARRGPVVLALEMFERDVQPLLDEYLAGRTSERAFLAGARPWRNYATGYRPLIEAAKRRGLPVVASNAPAGVRRTVASGGADALNALPAAERGLLPPEILPQSAAYWERFRRVLRGHMGATTGPTDPGKMLYTTQSLWDNCMGWSCAQALARHRGHVLLHVNGAFHTRRRQGTVEQLLLRRPSTRVLTVELIPVEDLRVVDPAADAAEADFVVYCERRGRGVQQGQHAVPIAPELRFRLHVPEVATAEKPAPLLVWLPDEGQREQDAAAYWRSALGARCAIAVVEPPQRYLADNLLPTGRWFWTDRFDEDMRVARAGLQRVTRHIGQRFPIDRRRIVLAGEGTGATLVVNALLYGNLDVAGIALAPRRFHKLRETPLPEPSRRDGRLRVLARPGDADWWQREAGDHHASGLPTEVAQAPSDLLERMQRCENTIRAELGLQEHVFETGRTLYLLETDSPVARQWALRLARRQVGVRAIATTRSGEDQADVRMMGFDPLGDPDRPHAWFRPEDLSDGKALPLHPSPFGGTTVLVVPAATSEPQRARWQALADDNVIRKRSRFAQLRIAYEDVSPKLPEVLEGLRASGRRNVLIVPAAFCASGDRMRTLSRLAQPWLDSMNIVWLPGLGGRLD